MASGSGSTRRRIDGAAINEAVSNSILAYVAPVLARSSEVTGKVTVAVNKGGRCRSPATGPMTLDGAMAFQNVGLPPRPARRRADLDHRPGRARA